jgi:hypothetical protein
MDIDDSVFEAALQPDEAPPAPQGDPGDKAAPAAGAPQNPESPANPNPTSTTAPSEEPSNAPAGEQQGALAKEMEPFKTLLESKKWDPAKPEFGPTVLKSYQELEARASRTETASKQISTRADQLAAVLEGDLDGINHIRQSRGLTPISGQKPLESRKQEFDSMVSHLNRILQGQDQDGQAYAALNKILTDHQDGLRLEELDSKRNPGKSREEVFEGRKQAVAGVLGSLFQESKDAQAYVDSLTSHFDPGGLFYALGIDILDAFKTPELAKGFAELGQALHVLKNLDKVTEDRVKAEVERRRAAENGGGDGAQPERKPTTQPDAVDMTEIFA